MSRRTAFILGNAMIFVALASTSVIHATRHDYSVVGTSRFVWDIAYLVLLVLMSYAFGLPDATEDRSPLFTAIFAGSAAGLGISAAQLFLGSALLPRFVVFTTAGIVVVSWTLIVRAYQRGGGATSDADRVVFVGSARDADTLRTDIQYAPERRAVLVATLAVDDACPVGRGDEPLVDVVIDNDASVLVLGRDVQRDRGVVTQASTLHESGIRVRALTDFYAEWLGKLPAFELQRMSLMFDIREVHEKRYARLKRLLDVVAGLLAGFVLVLVLPFVWIGNLLANRGPIFYRQDRVGASGRTFSMLKFRTMRTSESTHWTSDDDPRVTPFGRVLRRTHLDELPQAVNILRGELSIVGPRPEQPQYVATLVECLPFYKLRHLVRPGLTGWAQVKYGYAADEHDALQKLQYDFYYLQQQSLGLDLRIMARTMRSVVGADGS